MKFDLKNVVFDALDTTNLDALIIAPSGAGKSRVVGTLNKKVLYLYGPDEAHGKISAGGQTAEILALDWSRNPATKEDLNPDQILDLLRNILTVEFLKEHEIEAICIDSLTSLEKVILNSAWLRSACLTKDGAYNSWDEPKKVQQQIDQIINQQYNSVPRFF
jgi:hypothetical protein